MFDIGALVESVSAVICFILVWFMIKPYRLTGDARFLGLPLGFGIMGVSHVIATIVVAFSTNLSWFLILFRTFSFVFLAATYFFSSRAFKKTQQLWNVTLSALIVLFMALSLILFVAPQTANWLANYNAQIYSRVFMEIFLTYIIIFTLRTHVKKPDPNTIWIPFGFISLAISQYTLILAYITHTFNSNGPPYLGVPYWAAMAFRFAGLLVFLAVAYRTFYSKKEFE